VAWFWSTEKEVLGKCSDRKVCVNSVRERCVCYKKQLRTLYRGKYLEQRVYNDKTLKESVWKPSSDEILWANTIWRHCIEYEICSRVREESSEKGMWIEETMCNKWMATCFSYLGQLVCTSCCRFLIFRWAGVCLFVVFSYLGQLLCTSGCRFLIFKWAGVCFCLSCSHI
jgi:hypothetical protein